MKKLAKLAVVLAAFALAIALPLAALGAPPKPNYDWYTPDAQSYEIESAAQWVGFASLVNGTADTDGDESTPAVQDSFAGKTVTLTRSFSFAGNQIEPVGGGAYGTSFDGDFDGGGNSIQSFKVSSVLSGAGEQGATEYIGLFGRTGEGSSISNLNVGGQVEVSVLKDGDAIVKQPIRYVGLLAGYVGGPVTGCTADGTVSVAHDMDQTEDVTLPIQWVGGMAGAVQGDLTGCSSSVAISISETGAPAAEVGHETLGYGFGGLVGCVGSPDSTVDPDTARIASDISNCSFNGRVDISTPSKAGKDRFGNTVYAATYAIGGIAGYTRGNVADCTNSGTIFGGEAEGVGGIVGTLRGLFIDSELASWRYDDGMEADAPTIVISNCYNTGSLFTCDVTGGIVGFTGTKTVVTGCLNGADEDGNVVHNYVLSCGATKPCPGGISSWVNGVVCYCANFGEVASTVRGADVDLEAGTYTTGGGYYAAGIVGMLDFFSDAGGARIQGLSEVYGCYNAGPVRANSRMRQRSLVGCNSGYLHDCLAVEGTVEDDEMFFDEYGDGSVANVGVVRASDLKQNALVTVDGKSVYAAVLLNANGDADGWADYWSISHDSYNNGFPVVDDQVNWELTDISAAQVSLAKNAEYTGAESVPQATVVLDGTTLVQNVDFRVVPQAGAVALTAEGEAPYTGHIVGIGSYEGVAVATLAYGIGKGDLANCSVIVDPTVFNWEAQAPSADQVHVTNVAGEAVSPDEYTFELDPSDKHLTDGQAVNAATYTMTITAKDGSDLFYGSTTGSFVISQVRILRGGDGKDDDCADVQAIEYLGETYQWQSTVNADAASFVRPQFAYTGHSIKPTVTRVTYLGRDLVEGRDYRLVYGENTMDGTVDETPNTEVGEGAIIVRYVPGGNFSNYDVMRFDIVEAEGKLNLEQAVVSCPAEVVYEPGDEGYEPVTVSYGGSPLTEGVDYEVSYERNNEVGTASYTVTGVGAYEGAVSGTFDLVEGQAYRILYEYGSPAEGEATVVGVEYDGIRDSFALEIPGTVERGGATYTVAAVAAKACGGSSALDFTGTLANASKLKVSSVSVPATVRSIGANAFGSTAAGYGMANLGSVEFAGGSQLASIGKQAFANTGLTEVEIPAGVASIGDAAFKGCSSLGEVAFLARDASIPAWRTANSTLNAFRDVKDVRAYGYASAATARANVEAMDALSGYTWTWEDLPDAPAVSWGDADADGNVNSLDALLALQYSAGKVGAADIELAACDVDGDGNVNSLDALLILQLSAGKIDKFPVEA